MIKQTEKEKIHIILLSSMKKMSNKNKTITQKIKLKG